MTEPKPSRYICYHGWHPATSDKPPAQIHICKCGKNTYCPTCGFGTGAIPCDCDGAMRKAWDVVSESVLEENADLWRKLAEL